MAGRMINGAAALAELVRPAGETDEPGAHRLLPVLPELGNLLPGRGLRRGSTVAVATGRAAPAGGGTSLLLALLAAASQSGSWCAVVGVPALGTLAAADSGIALDRLALVPNPGPDWPTVVAALIDGVDLVVMAVPGPISASIAGRLVARNRQRGSVLVPFGDWDGADVTLQVTRGNWEGLGTGHGRLRRRRVTVLARGRGAAARPRELTLWMPGTTVPPTPPGHRSPRPASTASTRRALPSPPAPTSPGHPPASRPTSASAARPLPASPPAPTPVNPVRVLPSSPSRASGTGPSPSPGVRVPPGPALRPVARVRSDRPGPRVPPGPAGSARAVERGPGLAGFVRAAERDLGPAGFVRMERGSGLAGFVRMERGLGPARFAWVVERGPGPAGFVRVVERDLGPAGSARVVERTDQRMTEGFVLWGRAAGAPGTDRRGKAVVAGRHEPVVGGRRGWAARVAGTGPRERAPEAFAGDGDHCRCFEERGSLGGRPGSGVPGCGPAGDERAAGYGPGRTAWGMAG